MTLRLSPTRFLMPLSDTKVLLESLEDVDALLDAGLADLDHLKAPGQGPILAEGLLEAEQND